MSNARPVQDGHIASSRVTRALACGILGRLKPGVASEAAAPSGAFARPVSAFHLMLTRNLIPEATSSHPFSFLEDRATA